MVTKNDERKALEKIKKIVEELGDDSYIAVAFEGCFDIAEDNINNDMACSMKQRYEIADKEAWEAQKSNKELKEKLEEANTLIETQNERITNLKLTRTEYIKEIDSLDMQIINLNEEITNRDAVIANYKDEVVQLKAKLYDMICVQ